MKECVLWLRGSSAFSSRWLEMALLCPCDLGAPLMMQLRWRPFPLGEEELCHTAQPLKAAVPASSSRVSCPGTRSLLEDKAPVPHLPSLTPGCVLTWTVLNSSDVDVAPSCDSVLALPVWPPPEIFLARTQSSSKPLLPPHRGRSF